MGESVLPQPSPTPPGTPVPTPKAAGLGKGGDRRLWGWDLRWSLENVLSRFGQLQKSPGTPALNIHAILGLFISTLLVFYALNNLERCEWQR